MEKVQWDSHGPPRVHEDNVPAKHNAEETMANTHEKARGKGETARKSGKDRRRAIEGGKARNNLHARPGNTSLSFEARLRISWLPTQHRISLCIPIEAPHGTNTGRLLHRNQCGP